MLKTLENSNVLLDNVQKKLIDYMEEKRKAFPRFFFLSNEDLLGILAQTKDPKLVQPHLSKCFEAINKVEFGPNEAVLSMLSPEKEQIKFLKKIEVNSPEFKGFVEKWMLEIQK